MLIDRLARVPRRVPVLFSALMAVGLLLAGCGNGPHQAGSAAIVGANAVPLSEVQRRVDAVLARPDIMRDIAQQGGAAADIARFVVTSEVHHLLLAEAARRDGIVIDDRQVDAELAKPGTAARLAGRLVLDPADAREAIRDQLIAQELTTRYLDRLSVTLDLAIAGSRSEAMTKARQLAAGPAQAEALLKAEGKNAQRDLQLRAALVPQQAALFLFGTPAGQVVAVQTSASPEVWTVLRVTKRDTNAPPADPNLTSVSQLGVQTMDEIGRRLTQPLAEELGVRVNPRYGNWDPVFLAVVSPEEPRSLVLPAVLN